MAGKPKGLPKSGGRKAGTPNKATAGVKEGFRIAFENLGGAEALTAWGRENQTDFYKLASKLIPTEIANAEDKPFQVATTDNTQRVLSLLTDEQLEELGLAQDNE